MGTLGPVFGDDWYTVGLVAGLATALGVLLATALAPIGGGIVIGAAVWQWEEAIAGAVGGALGALGAWEIVRGALRRGGTRGGTTLLVAAAAVVLAALALVPVIGYLEAVVVPAVAARLRRRSGRTYAGLRILARD